MFRDANRFFSIVSLSSIFAVGMAAAASAQAVNHQNGFTGQTDLTLLGNASLQGSRVQLTPPIGSQTGGVFTTAQVPIGAFVTRFTFHELGAVGGMADGIGFCIQRKGVGAGVLGGTGGGMGYIGMATSIFVKFDNYNNESSTGLYQNGADPSLNSIDMRAAGVDVHTQHDFQVDMTYNGTTLAMTVKDLTTNATFSRSFTVDIATVIGGATAYVGFTGATGGAVANQEILNWAFSSLAPPTNLATTAGPNTVSLTWGATTGATSYTVMRGTTAGGPYTQVAANVLTTNYTDNTATFPNTYYYVVFGVGGGGLTSSYSNEAQGIPLVAPVQAIPNSGLQTNENLTTTTFNVRFNTAAPAGGSVVQVLSGNTGEGVVSETMFATTPAGGGTGIQFTAPAGFTGDIPITITGVNDNLADGNITYTITVTASGMGVGTLNVSATNNDNDQPGVTFSRTSGLVTTESGGTDSFTVSLNTQPFGDITMSLASNLTSEGTVSPASITFTNANWNSAQQVTLTGVGDTLIDFSIPYTILSGNLVTTDARDTAAYNGMKPPDVSAINLDDEAIPDAPAAWGGCGLLGLEMALVLGLAALRRRRA